LKIFAVQGGYSVRTLNITAKEGGRGEGSLGPKYSSQNTDWRPWCRRHVWRIWWSRPAPGLWTATEIWRKPQTQEKTSWSNAVYSWERTLL